MLRRKIYQSLLDWKAREGHKPLLVRGQRQVGKTFIIREFSKTYGHSVEVDLSSNVPIREKIKEVGDVDSMVELLELVDRSFNPVPGDTLIFLDEIQSSPHARAMLKAFSQDGRYDVVASGSLLGIPLKDEASTDGVRPLVPVGYEEHLTMYGLDFEEFLWSKGYRPEVIGKVAGHIRDRKPLGTGALEVMSNLFREYMIVGGMPEAVSSYVQGAGINAVRQVQDRLLASIFEDISKYSRDEDTLKIRRCMESIPYQLSQTSKKFMYSRIEGEKSRTGARKYGDALLWIEGAGIVNTCHLLREISRPVGLARDPDQFKVYMSDTGLLVRMSDGAGDEVRNAVYYGRTGFNQGAITENAVAECLMKSGIPCNYYIHRKDPGRMELDFVMDLGPETAVIEVKSGKDRSAPSLRKTSGDARFQRRIMLENSDIHVDEDGVEHYPLFAVAFIDEMKRPTEPFEIRPTLPLDGLLRARQIH